MSLHYRMEIFAIKTEDGFEYVAHFPALKGVSGGGESQLEAIQCLQENAEYYIEVLKEEGFPIPKEDLFEEPKKYSGTFSVRTTSDAHEYLSKEATKLGISLNAHISNIFYKHIGGASTLEDLKTILKKFEPTSYWASEELIMEDK